MQGSRAVIKVVLVEGAIGDWAAYVAPGDWSDDEVARHANKLSEHIARQVASLGGYDSWTTRPYREQAL